LPFGARCAESKPGIEGSRRQIWAECGQIQARACRDDIVAGACAQFFAGALKEESSALRLSHREGPLGTTLLQAHLSVGGGERAAADAGGGKGEVHHALQAVELRSCPLDFHAAVETAGQGRAACKRSQVEAVGGERGAVGEGGGGRPRDGQGALHGTVRAAGRDLGVQVKRFLGGPGTGRRAAKRALQVQRANLGGGKGGHPRPHVTNVVQRETTLPQPRVQGEGVRPHRDRSVEGGKRGVVGHSDVVCTELIETALHRPLNGHDVREWKSGHETPQFVVVDPASREL
jgi:hypothetical protein